MDANTILVDAQEIEGFRARLTGHLQQISSALSTLTHSDAPQLGSFYHAQQTEQHYDDLWRDYLTRLRRLILALAVSDASLRSISQAYDDLGQSNAAQLKVAADVLTSDSAARIALTADPDLVGVLEQDPQLSLLLTDPSGAAGAGAATEFVTTGGESGNG